MVLVRIGAIAVLVGVAVAPRDQSSPVNRPWPPAVQTVAADSPPLAPAEALKTFYMPPGYRLELVASEPLVQDPIAMDWDPDGRLWVVEMPGFVKTLDTPEPNFDPIGRVAVLEDTNGDGRMDKRTVFADGLVLARSLAVIDHGVLVAEPPNVWLMHDTNGDLRMDTKDLVTNVYGRREARVEQNANAFFWAMDNAMHTANSDVFLRFKNGKFEVQRMLSRGEWGVTQDDAGRIYRNTNESPLHVDYVPTPYFSRHPNLLRTRGSYESFRNDDDDVALVWPVRPTPGTNRAYQFGIRRENGALARFTSVCAPLIYRGDRLPAELSGNAFVAEPAANLVSRIVLSDEGTKLRAKKAYDTGEFLASTDERFRPVYLTNAPDGTLYIADMYRGVIQQRADVTEYLRDHITSRKLEQPIGYGRIYRVMHESSRRDTTRTLTRATGAELVQALSHPNGWRRDAAQRILVERNEVSVARELTSLAGSAKDWRARLHALWTLDGLDRLEPATVTKALGDPSRDIRASAVRLSERWLSAPGHPVQAAVLKQLDDTDWAVRQQLAASLGTLPAGVRETAAASFLERNADDPIATDALLSGLRGSEVETLARLLTSSDATPRRETAVVMLAALVVRGGQDASVQALFKWLDDRARPAWQRSAILRGGEVALLGTTMPGTPTGRRTSAPVVAGPVPCPTCPGGRAGPGGSYAFAQVPAANSGRGGGPRLRLNREPAALTALAAATDDLGTRATALLARVDWPGKPGAPAPIAPLSPAEQRRFDAGAEVYKNICQACHQPDGRGQDRIAPPLIGSPLALAPPDVTARILLNGKEGPVGLMPPVGSVLSDDQIAAVLTYIRREWGHAASVVEPSTVKDVRALTAGRTRPWTHDELMKLAGGG